MKSLLDNARSFLGLGGAEVLSALGETAQQVSGDEYGKMTDVTSMEAHEVFPGTLYIRNDSVELIRIGPEELTAVTPDTLRAHFGTTAVRLASRAGKTAK